MSESNNWMKAGKENIVKQAIGLPSFFKIIKLPFYALW